METARIQSLKINLRKYVKLLQEVPPSLTKETEGKNFPRIFLHLRAFKLRRTSECR
jgi:hypothetical protein